jgi:hypothetical protein
MQKKLQIEYFNYAKIAKGQEFLVNDLRVFEKVKIEGGLVTIDHCKRLGITNQKLNKAIIFEHEKYGFTTDCSSKSTKHAHNPNGFIYRFTPQNGETINEPCGKILGTLTKFDMEQHKGFNSISNTPNHLNFDGNGIQIFNLFDILRDARIGNNRIYFENDTISAHDVLKIAHHLIKQTPKTQIEEKADKLSKINFEFNNLFKSALSVQMNQTALFN